MMLDAVLAIALLFVANFLVTWARTRLSGWPRRVVVAFSFAMLFPAFLLAVRALFF